MDPHDGEDLGALLARVRRKVRDAEAPVLRAQGLSMWS